MSTMYEKLADLLNKTLKDGSVKFIHVPPEDEKENVQNKSTDKKFSSNQSENSQSADHKTSKNQTVNNKSTQNGTSHRQTATNTNNQTANNQSSQIKNSNNKTSGSQTKEERKKILFENQFLSLSDKEKFALKVLALELPFDNESLKQAYKEKLKYYHPDHWNKNDILKNIAHKKTQEIINANEILFEYLKRHESLS